MNAKKAVGAGDNDLVHIAQLRQWPDAQLQRAAGVAFGLRVEAAADRCIGADQLREALQGRPLDKAVDRDAASELFAYRQ
ncbi:hypothetical protein D3C77_269480 [compost metagenome]